MRNLPAQTSNAIVEVEQAPTHTSREVQPVCSDEIEDDTRIVFASWDCALVPSSK